MSVEPDRHYVTEESGVWLYVAEVSHERRAAISSALEAHHVEYRFGAQPLTTTGHLTPGALRLFVPRDGLATAQKIVHGDTTAQSEPYDRDAEVTRMLCATAVRSAAFANSVLEFLSARSIGIAPEIGVDVPLLAQVCTSMQRRTRRRYKILFAITAAALLLESLLPGAGLVAFLLTTIVLGIMQAFANAELTSYFQRGRFSRSAVTAAFPHTPLAEVMAGCPDPEQNLVVYRWFTPFVGTGQEQGGWSFTIDIEKGALDMGGAARTPKPFAEIELYDRLMEALRSLALPNTTIRDMAFVFGEDIRDDRRILPQKYRRPSQRLTLEEIRAWRESNDHRVRCYPCVRIHDWESQIVLSQFIRLNRHGKHLCVELNRYLLTPLAPGYRNVDGEPPLNTIRTILLLLGGAIWGPLQALFSPLVVFGMIQDWFRKEFETHESEHRRMIDDNPRFNYGTARSLRESASGGSYTHYFQRQDTMMYSRILQIEILETIVAFLDEHCIDTSELREQRFTILNSGIIVNSGNVNATTVAVGANSTAHTTNPLQQLRPTVPQPTQKPKGANS